MDIRQIKLSRMDTFCYLVGDEAVKTCALIDPAFDTDKIVRMVKAAGYTVACVINTHGHADHCAGNAAVIKATGAKLMIHENDADRLKGVVSGVFSAALGGRPSPRPDKLLRHKDDIAVGGIKLTALHTPGHTPGGICLYTPGHVFTGDTLFVGAVGRTDMPGGSTRTLLASIKDQIYTLPGDTIVWPGHDYGETPSSTVARERATNPFTL
ncbi:MAG: MBL fold metallo-hydrolase [Thermodesulfobacteriota bacterium]